jgi:hypothetical protein
MGSAILRGQKVLPRKSATIGITTTAVDVTVTFYFTAKSTIAIDWGDGSDKEWYTVTEATNKTHVYATADDYVITVYFNRFTMMGEDGGKLCAFSDDNGSITSADFKQLTELTKINSWWGRFTGNLDMTGLVNLTSINLDVGNAANQNITMVYGDTVFSKLTQFDVDGNQIGNVDYSHFPAITGSILIDKTNCSALDVSPCPNVSYIRLDYVVSGASINPILSNSTAMVAFANTLPDRTGKTAGTIQILDSTADTNARSWIGATCTAKNWEIS